MATIHLTPEQAQAVATLSVARQTLADATAAEKRAKSAVDAFLPNVGDSGVIAGIEVIRVEQGTRSGLDGEIVKRRAPRAYALAQKTTMFRKIKIVGKGR